MTTTALTTDPRLNILMDYFGSEDKRGEAETLLQCLDEADPFRDMFVHVWDTENEQLVAWGTHDINLIIPKAERYYREELGLGDQEMTEMGLYERNLSKDGQFVWADPRLYHEEVWERNLISKEKQGHDWVPVFIYQW